jgi:hypothetical protein
MTIPRYLGARLSADEPDSQHEGSQGAPSGHAEGYLPLARPPGDAPLDDREREKSNTQELRVEGRVGKGQAQEVVEAVPGRRQKKDGQRCVAKRIQPHDETTDQAKPRI